MFGDVKAKKNPIGGKTNVASTPTIHTPLDATSKKSTGKKMGR